MEGGREEGWLGREGERGWGEDGEREFKGEQQGKTAAGELHAVN